MTTSKILIYYEKKLELLVNTLQISYPNEYINRDFNCKDFIQKVDTCVMKIGKIEMIKIRKPPNSDCIF